MTQYKGNKPNRKHNHHVHFNEIYIPRVGKCGTKLEFNLDIIFNLVKLNTATRVHFSMFQVYRKVRNTIISPGPKDPKSVVLAIYPTSR